MSSKVQGCKKIQIVHAYLESGRNPLIKVLVMFFSAFVLRILRPKEARKKTFFLKKGKTGYKKMQNFMLISDLKKCFRNTAPKMFYPKRSFFFLGTIFGGKAVFFLKYRFGALFLKHSFRADTHVDLC
jgi:hypothetical protein